MKKKKKVFIVWCGAWILQIKFAKYQSVHQKHHVYDKLPSVNFSANDKAVSE